MDKFIKLKYTEPNKHRENITSHSHIIIQKNWYKLSEDKFNILWNLRPQEDTYIKIFGKSIKIPRKNKLFSIDNSSYTYSGQTMHANNLNEYPILLKIFNLFNRKTGYNYNAILVNWYKDGSEYIGKHSDDENGLDVENGIWSLSFGSARNFNIHKKNTNKLLKKIVLEDGDLIGMCGNFQKELKHSLPATKKF